MIKAGVGQVQNEYVQFNNFFAYAVVSLCEAFGILHGHNTLNILHFKLRVISLSSETLKTIRYLIPSS